MLMWKASKIPEFFFYLFCGFAALLIILICWWPYVESPHEFLFTSGLDGLRTYFTSIFYSQHDQGIHFSGMNYPYGEHVYFSDNLPFFSYLIGILQRQGILAPAAGIPILHFLLFSSLIVSSLLIYSLLRYYGLPSIMAVICALLICFLSPQIERFESHLGLAFPLFVPLVWRLLLYWHTYPWKAGMYLLLTLLLFGGIHGYYLMIGATFILAYTISFVWQQRKGPEKGSSWLFSGLFSALLPLVIYKLLMMLTDQVGDRPIHPYGFFAYRAHWEGIFLPHEGPIWEGLNQLINVRKVKAESYAYTGILGFIVSLTIIIRAISLLIQGRRAQAFMLPLPKYLNIALGAAILVLLFSMALPFRLGLQWMVDILVPLKQFRALGRFAWVFYYVFTVSLSLLIYDLYLRLQSQSRHFLAVLLLSSTVLIWSFDVWVHLAHRQSGMLQAANTNVFRKNHIPYTSWLASEGYRSEDFQSILPLPFFHIGSDKFSPFAVDYYAHRESLIAAWQLSLPLSNGIMTRTSLHQSLELIQLLGHPDLNKCVLEKYDHRKPILILNVKEASSYYHEEEILKEAYLIGEKENIQLFAWEPWLKVDEETAPTYLDIDSLLSEEAISTVESGLVWELSPLPTQSGNEKIVFGQRTLSSEGKQRHLSIWRGKLPNGLVNKEYEFSIWIKADLRRDAFPFILYEQFDAGGKLVDSQKLNPKFSADIFQDWVRVGGEFSLRAPDNQIIIRADGKYATVSSLMIRPLDREILGIDSFSNHILNNFPLTKECD